MQQEVNVDLSRPEWWIKTITNLSERYPALQEFGRLESGDTLEDVSRKISEFDTWLTRIQDAIPENIIAVRTILGGLKKFRTPSALPASQIPSFLRRNEECSQTIPRRFVDGMRYHLGRALAHYDCDDDRFLRRAEMRDWKARNPYLSIRDSYDERLKQVNSLQASVNVVRGRFGPGAVIEGWGQVGKWEHLYDVIHDSGFDPLHLEFVQGAKWSPGCKQRTSETMGDGCQRGCVDQFAKVTAVPKDWNKERIITVEPLGASFVQQWCRRKMLWSMAMNPTTSSMVMESDFRNGADPQIIHGQLALKSSITRANSTLDLSDASDRVGYGQVCSVFPPNVMADLDRSRSELVVIGDSVHPLRMYGGMGNATTFVVETLVFWAACRAIADYHRIDSLVTVFGDDIIVSTELAEVIIRCQLFEEFGWKINLSKSMHGGCLTRESCGTYAWLGHDVRLFRLYGYGKSRDCDEWMGLADLIRRLSSTNIATDGGRFLNDLAGVLYDNSTLHNDSSAPNVGSNVWVPSRAPRIVRSRWRQELQRMEWLIDIVEPLQASCSPTTLGVVYGALSGQVTTRGTWRAKNARCLMPIPHRFVSSQQWVPSYGTFNAL